MRSGHSNKRQLFYKVWLGRGVENLGHSEIRAKVMAFHLRMNDDRTCLLVVGNESLEREEPR